MFYNPCQLHTYRPTRWDFSCASVYLRFFLLTFFFWWHTEIGIVSYVFLLSSTRPLMKEASMGEKYIFWILIIDQFSKENNQHLQKQFSYFFSLSSITMLILFLPVVTKWVFYYIPYHLSVIKHWSKLLRQVLGCSSPEILRTWLDTYLSNLL